MGVVFSQDLSDNLGTFCKSRCVVKTHVVHGKKDSSMNRFKPVPNIRKSTGNNNTHCIVNVGFCKFCSYFNRLNFTYVHKPSFAWKFQFLISNFQNKQKNAGLKPMLYFTFWRACKQVGKGQI